MKIKFDWDEKKAEGNFKKHRISFELAITVFDDPSALISPDEKHSNERKIVSNYQRSKGQSQRKEII